MTNLTVLKIAEKHPKSPAQICLKWAIQQNIVVIPKSAHKERIIANSELDDFMLDDEDMAVLFALPQVRLGSDPNIFFNFVENSWWSQKPLSNKGFCKNSNLIKSK